MQADIALGDPHHCPIPDLAPASAENLVEQLGDVEPFKYSANTSGTAQAAESPARRPDTSY